VKIDIAAAEEDRCAAGTIRCRVGRLRSDQPPLNPMIPP
jgi:hypothetical protein